MYSVYVWNKANSWWEWRKDFECWSEAYRHAVELNSKGYETDIIREIFNQITA